MDTDIMAKNVWFWLILARKIPIFENFLQISKKYDKFI